MQSTDLYFVGSLLAATLSAHELATLRAHGPARLRDDGGARTLI